jgi:hypothetical protein
MEHEGRQTDGCSGEISPLSSGGTLIRKPCISGTAIGTFQSAARPSATDWNERRTGDDSFPGSDRERLGVEAPASRVHKLRMDFGEADPLLH